MSIHLPAASPLQMLMFHMIVQLQPCLSKTQAHSEVGTVLYKYSTEARRALVPTLQMLHRQLHLNP